MVQERKISAEEGIELLDLISEKTPKGTKPNTDSIPNPEHLHSGFASLSPIHCQAKPVLCEIASQPCECRNEDGRPFFSAN